MTHPDRANPERVVPGPEYPEVRPRSAAIFPWTLAMLAVVVFVLVVAAAASRSGSDVSPRPTQNGVPQDAKSGEIEASGGVKRHTSLPPDPILADKGGAPFATEGETPPAAPRYRGTATWYCLSGSSACTRGYGPSDLVAAIDSDLGFGKGDRLVVRYRDRAVTVTVVDTCGCPGRRLIDLTSGAFRRLAPLGHGVIPVTVELAGAGSTLPPTTTEGTP